MTTIVIDRTAIDRLLATDEGFKIELTNSVVSHIARKFFEKDAARIISATEPELFAKALASLQEDRDLKGLVGKALTDKLVARDTGYYGNLKMSETTKGLVDAAIAQGLRAITAEIEGKVAAAIQGEAEKLFEARLEDLDAKIAARMDSLTRAYIENKIKEGITEKMSALKELIA